VRGLEEAAVRSFASDSPFPLAQRRIDYRPVGALSKTTLARLEPALFTEVAKILDGHPREKGLIHAPSYAPAGVWWPTSRRAAGVGAPADLGRVHGGQGARPRSASDFPAPTVLVSPSLREGVDLPDDFLRFQVMTKVPYPDLGDPWTAARRARDPRWYALETAKALVQAYGRSCRHADDYESRIFSTVNRALPRALPRAPAAVVLDAVYAAMRVHHPDALTDF